MTVLQEVSLVKGMVFRAQVHAENGRQQYVAIRRLLLMRMFLKTRLKLMELRTN